MTRSLAAVLFAVVVVPVVACGEVPTNHLADAPPGGSGDGGGGSDGATAGLVKVTAFDIQGAATPLVGAQVVFTDAKGTQRGVTDATGTASASVEDGGTVTVIGSTNGTNPEPFLQSVSGVKNGDHITLGTARDFSDAGSFTVKFTPQPGVTNYEVFGPCGATSVSNATGGDSLVASLSFQAQCKQDPMELVIVGFDAQSGLATISQDKTGVSFVAGGSTTLTGAFRPFLTLAASYTNGSDDNGVFLARLAPDNAGFESSVNAAIAGGTAKPAVTGPVTSTALLQSDITRAGLGRQSVFQRVAGDATTYGLDIAGNVLPWLGAITFDPATQTIKVPVTTEGSKGDAPDLFACEVGYARMDGTTGAQTAQFQWLIVTDKPGDVVLPTLPADLAGLAALATDVAGQSDCVAVESDQIAGYDAARLTPYAVFGFQQDLRSITGVTREATSLQNRGTVRAASRGRWSPRLGQRGAARAR